MPEVTELLSRKHRLVDDKTLGTFYIRPITMGQIVTLTKLPEALQITAMIAYSLVDDKGTLVYTDHTRRGLQKLSEDWPAPTALRLAAVIANEQGLTKVAEGLMEALGQDPLSAAPLD